MYWEWDVLKLENTSTWLFMMSLIRWTSLTLPRGGWMTSSRGWTSTVTVNWQDRSLSGAASMTQTSSNSLLLEQSKKIFKIINVWTYKTVQCFSIWTFLTFPPCQQLSQSLLKCHVYMKHNCNCVNFVIFPTINGKDNLVRL